MREYLIGLVGLCVVISAMMALDALAQDATKDLLTSQIREQGYRCHTAISAQRDLKRSKPNAAVWVLRCDNSSYRVRLIPDMAARVTRLE